ncbi:MAG: hypothetical protein FWC51_02415, partial [Proteobacteria bacterium]|nr:hypothetical protein [Pseudomonadota bacterium]
GFPRTENQVNMMITWCADNEYAIRYLLLEQSRAKTEFRTNIRKNIGTNLILRKDDAPDSVVVRYNEFEKHTRSVGEILTANPPSDFAMVTLDIDQIELVSKFLVGVFSTTQDDTNKNA